MKIKTIILLLITISMSGCSSIQGKKAANNIEPINIWPEAKKGFVVGVNKKDLHYFIKLDSATLKYRINQGSYSFLLDDNLEIGLLNLPFRIIRNNNKPVTESEILNEYVKWELAYQENHYKQKLTHSSSIIKSKNFEAILWTIQYPKNGKDAPINQIYLSVVKDNKYIICFNTILLNNRKTALKNLLIKTANTIRLSDKPITADFFD